MMVRLVSVVLFVFTCAGFPVAATGADGTGLILTATNGAPGAVPQTLIVLPGTTTPVSLIGFDVDDDPIVFAISSSPTAGSLGAFDSNAGTTSYIAPVYPMPAQDSFTFLVDDGIVDSEAATVTVLADNDSDGSADLDEGEIGTDPFDSDSDDDGLLDGVETGSGVYLSAADTGTSPLVYDTDADGAGDGLEVELGTDPTDPTSNPGALVPFMSGNGLVALAACVLLVGCFSLRAKGLGAPPS